jgi:hypothetical protein
MIWKYIAQIYSRKESLLSRQSIGITIEDCLALRISKASIAKEVLA